MVELSGVTGNCDLWKWFIRQKGDMHDFFKRWKGLSKHSFKNLENMALIQISSKDTPCMFPHRFVQLCATLWIAQLTKHLCPWDSPGNNTGVGCHAHGIPQAIILEWVAMPSFSGSSQSRDQTCVSCVSYIGSYILYHQCLTLFFWAPKSLQMGIVAMKLKDAYSLEGRL